MTYLASIPNILYDFSLNSDTTKQSYPVPDILTKIITYHDEQNYSFLTNDYIISGNESPEQVSYKLYGDPFLHWTILYINKITNMGESWPVPDHLLKDIVQDPDAIHHYEIGGIVADLSWITDNYGSEYAIPVTNIEFVSQENDLRRHIKVIDKGHIGKFVEDFNSRLI